MKRVAIATVAALLASSPVLAAETISATFTTPDGGVTSGSYSGIVDVTVSGVGQSSGAAYNDAFYIYTDGSGDPVAPYNDANYYQLTFGTTTLVGYDPGQDAKNFLVGPLPAYNPSHTYTFQLDTGLSTPGQLHFGVSDGDFGDNSGSYTITIGVPEPATWAMLTMGLFGLGAVSRRRRVGTLPAA